MQYNQIMALKELIAEGEGDDFDQQEIVENHYKGSVLNPGLIGGDGNKKEMARPNAKVEAKIGEKYVPKSKKQTPQDNKTSANQGTGKSKHQIWTQQQVRDLPISLNDPRPQPNFQTLYRQKVGTEDVFLGLSGVDPSSNHCNEILYKIELPDTNLKDIQIDLNEKQMVLQTKKYYLAQYFQYRTDYKKAKAEFVSDKNVLKLTLPVIRDNDF